MFLAQLDRALGTITSRAVMVKHVKSENLSADALEDLGRITNTYIQYNKAASVSFFSCQARQVSWDANQPAASQSFMAGGDR